MSLKKNDFHRDTGIKLVESKMFGQELNSYLKGSFSYLNLTVAPKHEILFSPLFVSMTSTLYILLR